MSKKQTTTTAPTNPAWVTSGAEGLAGEIAALSKIDPYSTVAGTNPLLDLATKGAMGLGQGGGKGAADAEAKVRELMNMSAPSISAGSGLDKLNAWMSPYLKDVLDATLADFDYDAGVASAADDLAMAKSQAFGGSGAALTKSFNEDNRKRARATTAAGIRDQGFKTAAQYSSMDADRATQASIAAAQAELQNRLAQLQGANSLFDFGLKSDANNRSNIGLQGDLGSLLREIEQQKLMAPFTTTGLKTGMFGSLPLNLFNGNTQTSKTSDPMGTLGTLIGTIGSIVAAPATGGMSLAGLGGMFGGSGGGGLANKVKF